MFVGIVDHDNIFTQKLKHENFTTLKFPDLWYTLKHNHSQSLPGFPVLVFWKLVCTLKLP